MRKSFMAIALTGLLGMTSCSDSFTPSVDFGDKTYINDYGKLVDAVNDLNATLGDRLSALNDLVKAGLYDIKVAIDANTGAINVQAEALKNGLDALNTSFLNGFTALNEHLDKNGTDIVNAINSNGELIALNIKGNTDAITNTGELISAQIKGSTTDLIATLKDNNKNLGEKLDAVNSSISTGLTELNASTAAIGSELKVTNTKLDDMNGHLKNLDTDLKAQIEQIGTLSTNVLNGFTTLNDDMKTLNGTVAENGTKIVSAIDKNGEVISAEIKTSGESVSTQIKNTGDVLSAQLQTSTTDIIKAMQDGDATIASKLDAVNTALNTGLANITAKIDDVNGSIKLQTTAIEGVNSSVKAQTEEIGKLSKNLLDGFEGVNSNLSTINTSLGEVNTSIASVQTAIKDMNEALGLKLDNNNKALNEIVAKINDNTTAISKISEDLGEQLKSLNDNMVDQGGKLVSAIDGNGKVIVEAIDEQGKVLGTINTGINTIGTNINTANGKLDNLNTSLGSMNTSLTTINGNIVALDKSMGTLNTNIETLATKIKDGDSTIVDAIKDLKKYENGIIFDDNDKNSTTGLYDGIYVTPQVWSGMDDAAKKALGSTLETIKANPEGIQVVNFTLGDTKANLLTITPHSNATTNPGHVQWIQTGDSGEEVVIKSTIVKDGITLFRVVKALTYSIFTTNVVDRQCSYKNEYYVSVQDARGTTWPLDYDTNKQYVTNCGSVSNVRLYLYDKTTGVFNENPLGRMYSLKGATGTSVTSYNVPNSFYGE